MQVNPKNMKCVQEQFTVPYKNLYAKNAGKEQKSPKITIQSKWLV